MTRVPVVSAGPFGRFDLYAKTSVDGGRCWAAPAPDPVGGSPGSGSGLGDPEAVEREGEAPLPLAVAGGQGPCSVFPLGRPAAARPRRAVPIEHRPPDTFPESLLRLRQRLALLKAEGLGQAVVRPVRRRSRRDEECNLPTDRGRWSLPGRFVQVRELLPAAAVMLAVLSYAGRLSAALGPRTSLLDGAVAATVGLTLFAVARDVQCRDLGLERARLPGGGTRPGGDARPHHGRRPAGANRESTVANSTIRYVGSALGAQVAAIIVAGQPGSHGYTIAFLVGAAGTGAAVLAALAIPDYRHAPPRAALRGRPHLQPVPSTRAGRPDRAVAASAGQVDE